MDTIGAWHLRECLLEMVYCFGVVALRRRDLPKPVVSRRVVLIDLQCRVKTLARLIQTVQFEEDISKVYWYCNVIRPQRAGDAIAADRVVKAAFLLVQLCEQVDPAKVFRSKQVGVQITITGGGEERIGMI